MTHHFQAALFHLGAILHAQSTCRGIARVSKLFLAIGRALLIDLFKILGSHIDFAANLDQLWDRVFICPLELMRNVFNHTCVSSDVFAHCAIATGRGGGKAPIAIDQIDRQAINLELSQISLCWGSIEPILHLASTKDIVQAHHPLKVLNILTGARCSTHLLGR